MKLKELIQELKTLDSAIVFPIGFYAPHSYRGSFDELAFRPRENVSVFDMLVCAERAVGETFTGFKGGVYLMTEDSNIRFAEEGRTNERVEAMAWGESDETGDIERLIFEEWKSKALEDTRL